MKKKSVGISKFKKKKEEEKGRRKEKTNMQQRRLLPWRSMLHFRLEDFEPPVDDERAAGSSSSSADSHCGGVLLTLEQLVLCKEERFNSNVCALVKCFAQFEMMLTDSDSPSFFFLFFFLALFFLSFIAKNQENVIGANISFV
jgi:hypothetical protein